MQLPILFVFCRIVINFFFRNFSLQVSKAFLHRHFSIQWKSFSFDWILVLLRFDEKWKKLFLWVEAIFPWVEAIYFLVITTILDKIFWEKPPLPHFQCCFCVLTASVWISPVKFHSIGQLWIRGRGGSFKMCLSRPRFSENFSSFWT